MICRDDIICNVSSYHIFLIGGYQFSVFLIDSSNIDTLSAVYSSLIAGQTLSKCQYLLFFLEHHFQKDCNSFGDTFLIFNARKCWYKLNLHFIILYPCSGHRDGLSYQSPWPSIGSSRIVHFGCCYWPLVHNIISTSSDELCSLEKDNLKWLGPLMVKDLDPSLPHMAVYSPVWLLGSQPFGLTWTKLWPKVQTWINKESFCCHVTAWLQGQPHATYFGTFSSIVANKRMVPFQFVCFALERRDSALAVSDLRLGPCSLIWWWVFLHLFQDANRAIFQHFLSPEKPL